MKNGIAPLFLGTVFAMESQYFTSPIYDICDSIEAFYCFY